MRKEGSVIGQLSKVTQRKSYKMFRSRRPDPFLGLYEEAHRREQAKKGTFLTQVVRSDGGHLLEVTDREERTPSLRTSRKKSARQFGEFASPFRVERDERDAERRRLQRYPTVSASSVFSKIHPKELGYRTMGHGSRRAKDIQFPVYLRENEARQDQLLREVEVREQKLAYIKNSQIVYDYTEEGKRKRMGKKGSKSADSKSSSKLSEKPAIKAVSKSNDELETLPDNEVGSEYTFETLPDGASYDYLIETEEVSPGATHSRLTSKPVKLVKKGDKGAKEDEELQKAEATPEVITPEAEEPGSEGQLSSEKAESKSEPSVKDVIGDENARKADDPLDESKPLNVTEAPVEKTTRFKDGPAEKIPDAVIGDETLEVAPKKAAHGAGVAAAGIEKKAKKSGNRSEPDEGVINSSEVAAGEPETYEAARPVAEDVYNDVPVTSPPADYNAAPRVVTFPEVEKKRFRFGFTGLKKKSQNRAPNPLASPQNPELLVKTDREGFLSKAVYDKVKYDNHVHSEWLTGFVSSEKKRYEEKQVEYDNKLADLKKEVERLEESMKEVRDDANELMEIRYSRLSKKFLDSTQEYIQKKNAIFAETKAIQDQKDKEAGELKQKHEEVQKEIAALNAEKDNVHREFIGWTNRLADYSAQLDAKMQSVYNLQQKHGKTQLQIDELSQKKADLEEKIAGHDKTHAENTKVLEKHANKEYLPQVHEIDNKISTLLNELAVIKQEGANEKVKLGSITKKLDEERKAHEEKVKLEAEERERKERDLLGKQRKDHEAAASELKKQHEEELRRMRENYEKQLQELREHQRKQTADAKATKSENKTHSNVATVSDDDGKHHTKSSNAKSAPAAKVPHSADARATGNTSRKDRNPFADSGITKSGDTREFTGDQDKPSGLASSSNTASHSPANEYKTSKKDPAASGDSSLFDYETEEEVRSLY